MTYLITHYEKNPLQTETDVRVLCDCAYDYDPGLALWEYVTTKVHRLGMKPPIQEHHRFAWCRVVFIENGGNHVYEFACIPLDPKDVFAG